MKNILPLMILILLAGCDFSVPLKINEENVYVLTNPCGKIEFRASTFSNAISIYQNFVSGEYYLNRDLLNISLNTTTDAYITSIEMYDKNNEKITYNDRIPSDTRCVLEIILNKPINSVSGTLKITASGYLTCNGQSLSDDSISISL
ncbi:hypothetical protein [Fulvivirga ligni]|uniref:hypothetical protein n=1 Tax=Fulvivirga ligni TaxID=2904246 RepID=UPI001F34319D|nr:hypothetical protein [Fulvivirga ligni]UII21197.1 hypothetical protein LVD16_25510 [Fulvivirga ligni]